MLGHRSLSHRRAAVAAAATVAALGASLLVVGPAQALGAPGSLRESERNASTHVLGVHTVTLQLTNKAGTPLGSSDQFPMRAEQVSQLIWVIIGAGVGLLFAAIVVRLVRRVIRSRA